jgi:hypothetical protein
VKHAEAFADKHPTHATNIVAAFKRRKALHSDPVHLAATLLDPANFEQNSLGKWIPPCTSLISTGELKKIKPAWRS